MTLVVFILRTGHTMQHCVQYCAQCCRSRSKFYFCNISRNNCTVCPPHCTQCCTQCCIVCPVLYSCASLVLVQYHHSDAVSCLRLVCNQINPKRMFFPDHFSYSNKHILELELIYLCTRTWNFFHCSQIELLMKESSSSVAFWISSSVFSTSPPPVVKNQKYQEQYPLEK